MKKLNISGCIVKKAISSQDNLEKLFGTPLEYLRDISFAEATDLEHDENTIAVYSNEVACLIIYHAGQSYDVSEVKDDIVQFVLFSLANSYFFEQYHQGELQRRYMVVDGEVHEDVGEGTLQKGDDVEAVVKKTLDEFLQMPISAQLNQLTFQRYAFIDVDEVSKLPH